MEDPPQALSNGSVKRRHESPIAVCLRLCSVQSSEPANFSTTFLPHGRCSATVFHCCSRVTASGQTNVMAWKRARRTQPMVNGQKGWVAEEGEFEERRRPNRRKNATNYST